MDVILLVIHLILALALVIVVLLQRSEGGALGMGGSGGGGGAGMFTARGSANLLTRATAILATLFFCTSLALAIVSGHHSEPTSVIDVAPAADTAIPESTEPTIPATE